MRCYMISQYDIKRSAKKNADKIWFFIDENDNVIDREKNEFVCTLKSYTEFLRRKMHCDFEIIYECHATLQVIYRCKECGTVIFASDDVSYYDPNLCCPVCGDYETEFEYWSGEDIEKDSEKHEAIDFFMKMQKEQIESDKRYMKRKKYDWQIWNGRIELLNRAVYLDLECDNLFKTKLKGLKLKIGWAHKDGIRFVHKKSFSIPLSWSALKISIMIWRKNLKSQNQMQRKE